jgi:hypothetical protein
VPGRIGREHLAGSVAGGAGEQPATPRTCWTPAATLTNRELEVLGPVAEGYSNAAIAAKLIVSEATEPAESPLIRPTYGPRKPRYQASRVFDHSTTDSIILVEIL